MKNIVLIILFLVGIFITNIFFYYTSSDYRDFLKRVKVESTNTWNLNDFSPEIPWKTNYFSWIIQNTEEKKSDEIEKNKQNINLDNNSEKKEVVKLWKWYQEILNIFSWYDLKKLDVPVNLFDLTNEYPDEYYEYYSPKLTVYFFTSKNYNDLYDIFKVLQLELPFKINSTDDFWEKSFFINFNDDLNDSVVRLVIVNNWIVFWLKFDKNEYNNVKQKLQTLRNN